MLVILKQNVENLGSTGDTVNVSPGYARNFLLPRGMVVAATEHNVVEVDHQRRILDKKRQKEREHAEAQGKKLSQLSVTLKRKAGEQDKLFGAVTTADIAQELIRMGFEIDRRAVQLADAIRTLGVFSVNVKLHPEVASSVKVWVVKEE